ncbi:MAG: ROK family protein [Alistipes sp.]
MCDCGKKGCLETEVSGIAIENKMMNQIRNGRTTILMDKFQKQHKIHINDIIGAARNDDTLSIELIEEAGEKIGKSIAFLINIFNPEQVIIGGSLANAGDYLMLPLKSAVNKYSLRLVYNDTLFRATTLDDSIGSLGAAMLIRNQIISL